MNHPMHSTAAPGPAGNPGGKRMKRTGGHWRRWAFLGCLLVFLISGGLLLRDQLRAAREREANAALAQQVRQAEEQLSEQEETTAPETEEDAGPLPQYQALAEQNADFYGWVRIQGTQLDYPVMYTPDRPEYYLRRAFDGSYAISGTPFLEENCFPGCGNTILYGHNMKDGSMFASVLSYADQAFWEEHPVIQFDTLEEEGSYEVLAAFYAQASTRRTQGTFPYYEYCDLREQERFEEYLSLVEESALYDTGVTAQYGDELLTLSTCSYHVTNGRFVVVARRIES